MTRPLRLPSPWAARFAYFAAMVATIGFGLLWRSAAFPLPPFARKYGGDALWALMVYFGLRLLFPRAAQWRSALAALVFAFGIECSQLSHAPWLEAWRHYRLGALVLGSTFNWPDFPAYTFGIALGVALDATWRRAQISAP